MLDWTGEQILAALAMGVVVWACVIGAVVDGIWSKVRRKQ